MKKDPTKRIIVIAEDDPALSHALETKLQSSGFDVRLAKNGEIALGTLAEVKPHVLILDIMMPYVDGFGVLEALSSQKSKVPIIVLTNLSQEEDIARATKLGAKKVLVKSEVTLAKIQETIESLL